jgi:hypothetical protein
MVASLMYSNTRGESPGDARSSVFGVLTVLCDHAEQRRREVPVLQLNERHKVGVVVAIVPRQDAVILREGCDGTRCVGAVAVSALAFYTSQLHRQCIDKPLELQSVIRAQTDPVKSMHT